MLDLDRLLQRHGRLHQLHSTFASKENGLRRLDLTHLSKSQCLYEWLAFEEEILTALIPQFGTAHTCHCNEKDMTSIQKLWR